MRLIYEEAPKILPKEIYNEIHRSIASQLLSTNKEKWNTIPMAYKELDDLKVKFEGHVGSSGVDFDCVLAPGGLLG